MSKITYLEREVTMEGEHPMTGIVEIKDLKDAVGKDEPKRGLLRMYVNHWPDGIIVQLRGKVPLTDRSQPRNLLAQVNLSIPELQAMLDHLKPKPVEPICENCKHWRHKATTSKGKSWGKCDNGKNEVKMAAMAIVRQYIPETWAATEIEDSVRYPGTFGCRFFEPTIDAHETT
jgi:hypothetical protein